MIKPILTAAALSFAAATGAWALPVSQTTSLQPLNFSDLILVGKKGGGGGKHHGGGGGKHHGGGGKHHGGGGESITAAAASITAAAVGSITVVMDMGMVTGTDMVTDTTVMAGAGGMVTGTAMA